MSKDLDRFLIAEQKQVEDLIRFYRVPGLDPRIMINHGWDAHDVLAHIVAWHESFALNVALLALGEEAQPPRGTLADVNRDGVLRLRGQSIPQLIRRMRKAQRTIEAHIRDESIGLIPYRKPGTSYTRAQHLDVVCGHIHGHFWELVDTYMKAAQPVGPLK
jgi:hypothetical protein